MQNIYLRLYEILEGGKYEIEEIKPFLIKLARNELYKYYSLKEKFKFIFNKEDNMELSDILDNISDEKINIEEELINRFMVDEIFTEIKKTDLLTQKIITLYYLQDFKINDIAQMLQLNESSVKSKLYRGLEKIRTNLTEEKKNE
jgi:RNA polymerase sigma-70 factor (ECF subfamily)